MSKEIKFSKVVNLIERQNVNIELFRETDELEIYKMLLLEVDELREAYEREEIDPIDLESEVGDIFYLLIRLALSTGIDPIEAIIAKVARNYRKYVGQESREVAKERWGSEQDHAFLSKFYNNYKEKMALDK